MRVPAGPGQKRAAVSDQVYSFQREYAGYFGMKSVNADDQSGPHAGQIEQVQLLSAAQAEGTLLTGEVRLTLPAAYPAIRIEAVRRVIEELISFLNSSSRN
jgi:hypothetical protein